MCGLDSKKLKLRNGNIHSRGSLRFNYFWREHGKKAMNLQRKAWTVVD